MPPAPATKRRPDARKAEPVIVPCCSDEEYADRTAKKDEVRDYIVPGYLAG